MDNNLCWQCLLHYLRYYALAMHLKKKLFEMMNQLSIEIACFASAETSPFSSNNSTKDDFCQK